MDCNVYDNDCHFTDQMLPLLWVLLMFMLMLMLFHQFCNVSKMLRAYWNTSINFSDGMQNLNTFGLMERFYLQYCTLFRGILLSVSVSSFRFHFVSIQLKNVQIRIIKKSSNLIWDILWSIFLRRNLWIDKIKIVYSHFSIVVSFIISNVNVLCSNNSKQFNW